jgi:arylsulfatase A-like enzyme
VVADDGFEVSPTVRGTVWLAAPPSFSEVVLSPDPPLAGAAVDCVGVGFTDDQGGPDQSVYRWLVDGEEVASGAQLDGRFVHGGDALTCEVVPSNGAEVGAPMEVSATVEGLVPEANLVLVVLDDVGTDQLATYDEHPSPALTPTMDRLADEGTWFRNVWTTPSCSPARGTLMTGRHGFRNGLGRAIHVLTSDFDLPLAERTLPEVLGEAGYATGSFGKWHLGSTSVSGPDHPRLQGFDTFVGSFGNLTDGHTQDGQPQDYFDWEVTRDGVPERTDVYATTFVVDEALAWVGSAPEPWFVHLSFQAPHTPFHVPPASLMSGGVGPSERARYQAMLEAVDTELGRFLDGLGDAAAHTTVVVIGDNGTPGSVTTAPFDDTRAKKTLYEGGIGVPLLLHGAGVPAIGELGALTAGVDLFATLTDVAGVRIPLADRGAMDSVSLVPYLLAPERSPVREVIYSEFFEPNGLPVSEDWGQAVRDARYKLVRWEDGTESLFDLDGVDIEGDDLLEAPLSDEAQDAYDVLGARLDTLQLR